MTAVFANMLVKCLKQTHDLTGHNEWSQAMGNLRHFPSRWTHLALSARNPPPFLADWASGAVRGGFQQAGATLCCGTRGS